MVTKYSDLAYYWCIHLINHTLLEKSISSSACFIGIVSISANWPYICLVSYRNQILQYCTPLYTDICWPPVTTTRFCKMYFISIYSLPLKFVNYFNLHVFKALHCNVLWLHNKSLLKNMFFNETWNLNFEHLFWHFFFLVEFIFC